MKIQFLYLVTIVGLWATSGLCEVLTNTATCEDAEPEHCTVHQIRVSPCEDAASGKPCKIKKGTSANIQFDFTPNFDANTVSQRAYKTGGFIDLPLLGMESDGCTSTTCPVVSGQNSTYNFDLLISTSFPIGTYNVKWRMWNPDDEKKECCFIYKLKLVN